MQERAIIQTGNAEAIRAFDIDGVKTVESPVDELFLIQFSQDATGSQEWINNLDFPVAIVSMNSLANDATTFYNVGDSTVLGMDSEGNKLWGYRGNPVFPVVIPVGGKVTHTVMSAYGINVLTSLTVKRCHYGRLV